MIRMRLRFRLPLPALSAAIVATAFASGAHAATVTLKSAWMRPAAAGTASAQAYVDIVSDAALELVEASTPAATTVEVVRVTSTGTASSARVVTTLRIAADAATRLAYLGDYLRLREIRRDLRNGQPVPLILVFKDASGQRIVATTDIVVRGVLLPEHLPRMEEADAASGAGK
jgi:copper(I)-binding protein